jgi:hypothetical protein
MELIVIATCCYVASEETKNHILTHFQITRKYPQNPRATSSANRENTPSPYYAEYLLLSFLNPLTGEI